MVNMEWNFSFSAFFIGLAILVFGTLLVIFHQKLADNLASGVTSYDKFKLAGIIFIAVGLFVMVNLHTLLLTWLVDLIFRRNG